MESLILEFLKINLILNGDGNGYGNEYGDGNGDGDGNGNGYGDGYGNGYGDGYGDGLIKYNNNKVYYIDTIPTIIYSIKNNIAIGSIINNDLTLSDCYIVKNDNYFAHGKSIKEAYQSLNEKIFRNLSKTEIISKFKETFSQYSNKYPAKDLFNWHNLLTGSCKIGRESFCKNHNINIEKDSFTIYEFIELTKNSYGGEVIKSLL